MTIDHETAEAAGDSGEVNGAGGGLPENHIAAAGTEIPGGTNDQVGEAITIHIPGTGHAGAASVVSDLAIHHEATSAPSDGGEVNSRGVDFAKDHKRATGILHGSRIAPRCPYDQISKTIAVDITGTGHAPAAHITLVFTTNLKAAIAESDGRDLNSGCPCLAEDNIRVTRAILRNSTNICAHGANDEIG